MFWGRSWQKPNELPQRRCVVCNQQGSNLSDELSDGGRHTGVSTAKDQSGELSVFLGIQIFRVGFMDCGRKLREASTPQLALSYVFPTWCWHPHAALTPITQSGTQICLISSSLPRIHRKSTASKAVGIFLCFSRGRFSCVFSSRWELLCVF